MDEASTEAALPLWELIQTSHVVTRAFKAVFDRHGLTPTQFGVLASLADGDDFTKAQLARAMLVTPQSMDPIIDQLLKRQLVRRDGPARKGRAAGICITELGRQLLAAALPDVATLNSPANIGLSPAEVPGFIAHLRAIRQHVE